MSTRKIKSFFAVVLALTLNSLQPSLADTNAAQLVDLGGAITSVADAFDKVVNTLDSATKKAIVITDSFVARNRLKRLENMSKALSALDIEKKQLSEDLHTYQQNPTEKLWGTIKSEIEDVLVGSNDVLKSLHDDNSGFVTEEAYNALEAALNRKSRLFENLRSTKHTAAKSSLKNLKTVTTKYDGLIKKLEDTRKALNKYISKYREATIVH